MGGRWEAGEGGGKSVGLKEGFFRVSDDPALSREEAGEYLQELIDSEVLVSSLVPLLTGIPPLQDLIAQLDSIHAARSVSETLVWTRDRMAELDARGPGSSPAEYRNIATKLETLPVKFDIARLYQVDMTKPFQAGVVGAPLLDEIKQGIELLCRLGRVGEPKELQSFRDAFSNRYERAWAPLLEALDPEIGIGFGATSDRDGS